MSWTNIFQTYKEVSKQRFLISAFYKGLEHSIKPYTHESILKVIKLISLRFVILADLTWHRDSF